jgi:hypothetical protein
MRFVQGTIKRLAKGEGGTTRLLLERKDGTEFVAVVSKNIHIGGVGTLFKAGGFEQVDSAKGRDCYEQADDQPNLSSTVITSSTIENPSRQIGGVILKSDVVEAEVASIELAAILNLSTQVLNQPLERVLTDINSIYKNL